MSNALPQFARHGSIVLGAGAALLLIGCATWPVGQPLEPLLSGLQEPEARETAPPFDPRQRLEALRSRVPQERLGALQAWNDLPPGPLPVEVTDLRTDPSPQVRAAAMTVLAHARVPQAFEYLKAGLSDNELQVRTAAVAALGELKGPEAQATLEKIAKSDTEVLRAAAVTALASFDAQAAVTDAAADRSWRVRMAVAKALRRYNNPPGIALAGRLLDDPSAGVQQETVKAVADWPLARSGPILLAALGRSGYMMRKTAAQQLATRWQPAGQFPIDGPPERRAEVLAQLEQRFREEIGPTEIALASAVAIGNGSSCKTADYLAPADNSAQNAAVAAALARLTDEDILVRRRAAGELAKLASRHSLGEAAVARLVSVAVQEKDPLVWQDLLAAVAAEGCPSAMRLAYAATKHASPEVRRLACQHLAAHPDARHVALLRPLLTDENDQVAGAAARAMGALGRIEDPEPLRGLLTNRNELLRVDAAAALARLGDPAGLPALERLSYSHDAAVRRQVTTALAELRRPEAVPLLIRLLDDRPEIRRVALEGLPRIVGQDVTKRPGQPAPNVSEQVALWKQWFASQAPASATIPPPPPPQGQPRLLR